MKRHLLCRCMPTGEVRGVQLHVFFFFYKLRSIGISVASSEVQCMALQPAWVQQHPLVAQDSNKGKSAARSVIRSKAGLLWTEFEGCAWVSEESAGVVKHCIIVCRNRGHLTLTGERKICFFFCVFTHISQTLTHTKTDVEIRQRDIQENAESFVWIITD